MTKLVFQDKKVPNPLCEMPAKKLPEPAYLKNSKYAQYMNKDENGNVQVINKDAKGNLEFAWERFVECKGVQYKVHQKAEYGYKNEAIMGYALIGYTESRLNAIKWHRPDIASLDKAKPSYRDDLEQENNYPLFNIKKETFVNIEGTKFIAPLATLAEPLVNYIEVPDCVC